MVQGCQSFTDLARLITGRLRAGDTSPEFREITEVVGMSPQMILPIMRSGDIIVTTALNPGSDGMGSGDDFAVLCGLVTVRGLARCRRMLQAERRLQVMSYTPAKLKPVPQGLRLTSRGFMGEQPAHRRTLGFMSPRDLRRQRNLSPRLVADLIACTQVILWDPQRNRNNVLWPAVTAAFSGAPGR